MKKQVFFESENLSYVQLHKNTTLRTSPFFYFKILLLLNNFPDYQQW